MLDKLESYYVPWSENFQKEWDYSCFLYEKLPGWKKATIAALSILVGIFSFGGGGIAVFRELVTVWQDPSKGGDGTGAGSSETVTKTNDIGKEKLVDKDELKNSSTEQPRSSVTPSVSGKPSESPSTSPEPGTTLTSSIHLQSTFLRASLIGSQNNEKEEVSLEVIDEILGSLEHEAALKESLNNIDQINQFFLENFPKAIGSERVDQMQDVLLHLGNWDYQLTEWHRTLRELHLKKNMMLPKTQERLSRFDESYSLLWKQLKDKLEQNRAFVELCYAVVKDSYSKEGMENLGLDSLYLYAGIVRFMERFHSNRDANEEYAEEKLQAILEKEAAKNDEKKVKCIEESDDSSFVTASQSSEEDEEGNVVEELNSILAEKTLKQLEIQQELEVLYKLINDKNPVTKKVEEHPLQKVEPLADYTPLKLNGIPNVGNTCYMNSSIQVTLGTRLVSYLQRNIPAPIPPSKEDLLDRNIAQRYQRDVDDYERKVAHRNALIEMQAAYLNNKEKDKAAKGVRDVAFNEQTYLHPFPGSRYSQHDAAEMITALLQGIGYSFKQTQRVFAADEEAFNIEEFNMMQLAIEPGKKNNALEDLFKSYRTEEINDPKNAWRAKPGKEYAEHTKELFISEEIPEVLVVQLKRFYIEEREIKGKKEYISRKHDTTIAIPDEIDLAKTGNIDPKLLEEGVSAKYRLAAYVNHHGFGASSGHYTANVRRKDEWHKMDDSSTSKAKSEKKDREKAYILVFERVHKE